MTEAPFLTVRVKAGAKRAGIADDGGVLTVRVTAPPVEGRANEAVRRALADALGIPPSAVRLTRGVRAREKRFAIEGRSEAELAQWRATLPGPREPRCGH